MHEDKTPSKLDQVTDEILSSGILRYPEVLSRGSDVICRKLDNGTSIDTPMPSRTEEGEATCRRFINPGGSSWPIHQHTEYEIIFVYKGSMWLVCQTPWILISNNGRDVTRVGPNQEVRLLPGDVAHMPSGTPHTATMKSGECHYTAMTHPTTQDF
jgi:quercetin dioxygenase-like cupin family protein